MSYNEFYKRSDDAVLAEKLMRLGQPLTVWLTDEDDVTTFHLMHFGEDGAYIDGKLQDSLKWQTSFFAFVDAKQAEFLLPIHNPVTLLQQEIALHKTTIKGFEAALELANEKVKDLDRKNEQYKARLGFTQSITSDREKTAEQLRAIIEERDHAITELQGIVDERDLRIVDLNRDIEILEDNLNRARSEHLEHLRALHQGLEGLSNFPNVNDKLMGAIHLLIRIAYANISKLDPML